MFQIDSIHYLEYVHILSISKYMSLLYEYVMKAATNKNNVFLFYHMNIKVNTISAYFQKLQLQRIFVFFSIQGKNIIQL